MASQATHNLLLVLGPVINMAKADILDSLKQFWSTQPMPLRMQCRKYNLVRIGRNDAVACFLANDINGSAALFDFSISLACIFNLKIESNSRRSASDLSIIAHRQSLICS